MSRRHYAVPALLLAGLLTLAACSSDDTGAGGGKSQKPVYATASPGKYSGTKIVYATPGPGKYQDAEVAAYVKPFEKLTGVQVVLTTEDDAKLTAMVRAHNVSWDVTDSNPAFDRIHCGSLLQKMVITGVEGSFPKGSVTPCGRPSNTTAQLFMYNAKTYKSDPPRTLADFFDVKKYPGKRVLPDQPDGGYYEYALLADGVSVDKLYPLDTDRAMKLFDRIKSRSKVTPTGSQEQQLMLNDQADLAIVPSTRAYSVVEAGGTNWKIMPTPAALVQNDWSIPNGAPHADIAAQFIKFASQPTQQRKFAQLVGGLAPANSAARVASTGIAAEVDPLKFATQFRVNEKYWSEHDDQLIKIFEDWVTS